MKLGFVDAILAHHSLKEVLEYAAARDFAHVEVCCWPIRPADERAEIIASSHGMQESLVNIFLGITHIDIATLDEQKVDEIRALQESSGVKISSLCFYGNPLETAPGRRERHLNHLLKMVEAAAKLDIRLVTTFIGRDQTKTLEDNLPDAVSFWTPIVRHAEAFEVKVAIENCPMYFTADQWPGGQNLFTSPDVWRKVFDAIPSDNLGLCFDPSHMIFQHMDYIQPIYDFQDKIFHVHFKDAKILKDKLNKLGILAYPLDYTAQKLPGHGDIRWGQFISALNDIGFRGCGSIEIEDNAFDGDPESVSHALRLAKSYLNQFIP